MSSAMWQCRECARWNRDETERCTVCESERPADARVPARTIANEAPSEPRPREKAEFAAPDSKARGCLSALALTVLDFVVSAFLAASGQGVCSRGSPIPLLWFAFAIAGIVALNRGGMRPGRAVVWVLVGSALPALGFVSAAGLCFLSSII